MSVLGTLAAKLQQQKQAIQQSIQKAKEWFAGKVNNMTGNQILAQDRARLVPRTSMGPRSIGRLFLFYYDPKHKKTLPYYDKFPLMMPIKFYPDGFLGLNFHYLPYDLRAHLLDAILQILGNKYLDEGRRLNITYQRLLGASRTRYFKPCVKRYLWNHVKSSFYQIDPTEWEMILVLPIEQFEKKSKSFVWSESQKMLGINKK